MIESHQPDVADSASDPLCLTCDYNLRGLPGAFCPECGTQVDWEMVRRGKPPSVAFERMTGISRIAGFCLTWLQVLFLPWRFARIAVQQLRVRPALVFGLLCMGSTTLAFSQGAPWQFLVAWNAAALVLISAQTLLLSLFDPDLWRRGRLALGFWLAISCYTSAIVLTEFIYGPPPLLWSDLLAVFTGRGVTGIFPTLTQIENWVYWGQLLLWSFSLACCFVVKATSSSTRLLTCLVLGLLVMLGELLLYATVVEFVGMEVYSFLENL